MENLKKKMSKGKEIFWLNEKLINNSPKKALPFTSKDIDEAEARLLRFAPYISEAFPETKPTGGIIESPLVEIPNMSSALGLDGKLFIKQDSELPISGSVKARGGIYEVLKFAERVAIDNNMLKKDEDYSILLNDEFKKLFSKYTISVGSTGNLGLSIGIISAQLGFSVKVYMSSDAKQWKKDLLQKKGAEVIESSNNYETAVAEGRNESENNPMCHFVDDENSKDLFLGYSVAGKRLAKQIEEMGIEINEDHPLCVYIPCGVGGAPGGITFGIKEYFGKNAHIYFAEPTLSPCMTLGLLTGEHNKIAVSYIGIRGKTIADGLAVGRPSKLASEIMDQILDGAFTVKDERLLLFVSQLMELENIFVEPSAAAAFAGIPVIDAAMPQGAIHIAWATGGAMVPQEEREKYLSVKA